MTALRVCHLVSSLEVGGAEWVALRLAAMQQKQGIDVELLSVKPGPLAQEAAQLGLRAHALGGASGPLRWSEAASFFAWRRFDVINSHNPPAHRYAVLARPFGFPNLVMTRHGTADRVSENLLRGPALDAVVAVSQPVYDAFRAQHPRFSAARVTVIDNGVETPVPAATDPLAGVRLPGHTIVFVAARLDPVKDLPTLVRAIAHLDPRRRRVQLVIAGDGPERAPLEALVAEKQLGDYVKLLGMRFDIGALLCAVDVFALSSLTEGMSLAALEAMAAGLPIVATRVGGNPEIVAHEKTGLLVPAQDPVALGDALARACDDAALRKNWGQAGRALVDRRFSLRRTVERYQELYARLAGRSLARRLYDAAT